MGWVRNAEENAGGSGQSPVRVRRGVKALVTSGSAVLLVKERHNDGTHFWTVPGGGVRSGESHLQALRRELREELDCEVRIGDTAGAVWYAHRSEAALVSRYTVMDCDIVSRPSPTLREGVSEYRWADPGSLPPRTLPQLRQFLCD
ncbi:NUDIX domain-containing protein [Natronomonas halophila]|uniref:NUDIX domain-containing protein n=1 Tax=Natronomonas halophila TaxID=2747817 RepID=UPI0015B6BE7F|nr:NUDIX domain-containing protein [Natronomonas halophila]